MCVFHASKHTGPPGEKPHWKAEARTRKHKQSCSWTCHRVCLFFQKRQRGKLRTWLPCWWTALPSYLGCPCPVQWTTSPSTSRFIARTLRALALSSSPRRANHHMEVGLFKLQDICIFKKQWCPLNLELSWSWDRANQSHWSGKMWSTKVFSDHFQTSLDSPFQTISVGSWTNTDTL